MNIPGINNMTAFSSPDRTPLATTSIVITMNKVCQISNRSGEETRPPKISPTHFRTTSGKSTRSGSKNIRKRPARDHTVIRQELRNPASTPMTPSHFQCTDTPSSCASVSIVITGFWRPRRPSMISAIIIGTPIRQIHTR